jgi:hypothetical protein
VRDERVNPSPSQPTNERKRSRPWWWQSKHYHNHESLQFFCQKKFATMRTSQAKADKRNMMRFVILSSTLMAGALAFHTAAPLSARQTPRSAVTPIDRTPSSQNWSKQRKRRQMYHAITWRQGTSKDNSSVSCEDILIPTPYPTPDHDEITTVDIAVLAGTTTFAAISLFALITLSAPGSWRYFLAGGICAATSHAIAVPIDVVKVSGRRFSAISSPYHPLTVSTGSSQITSPFLLVRFVDKKTGRPEIIRQDISENIASYSKGRGYWGIMGWSRSNRLRIFARGCH